MEKGVLHALRVYRKSLALHKLSEALAFYFSYNRETLLLNFRDDIIQALLTDAALITKKIEQAALSNSRNVQMRSLAFVNIMLRNMRAYCNGLERDGIQEKDYLNLLRGEIEVFKSSLKKWYKSFYPRKD